MRLKDDIFFETLVSSDTFQGLFFNGFIVISPCQIIHVFLLAHFQIMLYLFKITDYTKKEGIIMEFWKNISILIGVIGATIAGAYALLERRTLKQELDKASKKIEQLENDNKKLYETIKNLEEQLSSTKRREKLSEGLLTHLIGSMHKMIDDREVHYCTKCLNDSNDPKLVELFSNEKGYLHFTCPVCDKTYYDKAGSRKAYAEAIKQYNERDRRY